MLPEMLLATDDRMHRAEVGRGGGVGRRLGVGANLVGSGVGVTHGIDSHPLILTVSGSRVVENKLVGRLEPAIREVASGGSRKAGERLMQALIISGRMHMKLSAFS